MDRMAVLGLMLVALGAAIFMTGQHSMPLWAKFLVGPLLWYFGFALMVGWALLRILHITTAVEEQRAPEAKPEKSRIFVSNFLEHDYENV